MSLRGGSGRNWPALGPRLTDAVRALPLLSLASLAASASEACSRSGVRPLLTGLTVPRPSAVASDNSHLMSLTNS
jgi:hypothetical protein